MATGASASDVRILIADDDDLLREVLAAALEANGYPVALAPNGLVSPELTADADLVILDAHIPGSDFASTLQSLRRDAVRVLVLSGELLPPSGVPSHEYLGKPVDLADLLAAVDRLTATPARG